MADHLVGASRRGVLIDTILILTGVIALALSAQVRIPLGFTPVPISGQTFAVLLVGASLGSRRGLLSCLLYVILGVAGAPIFTDQTSGIVNLMGPTGGYLVGFVVAAALLGALAQRRVDRHVGPAFLAMLASSIVIYAFGLTGLMLATGASLPRAAELGLYPFIVGDLIKAALAGLALPTAWAIIARLEGDRK